MKKPTKKQLDRIAAKEEIKQLFKDAYACRNTKSTQAHKNAKKAYKLALKKRITLTKADKRTFCKHCFHYFIPGKNYRVRTTGKTITYTCLDCNKWQRFGY
jgi:ribonuclease P protein subunit RPR2